ncbi:conserved hypothetical protein [methanotrophic bacterial endosymbiont of Bathymodiolus sp.]|nr:conserved hypothetical protein [methanotrophic bacterial endosymbiont of Bathymodiolus sp.]
MGVFLYCRKTDHRVWSLPHARGGVSSRVKPRLNVISSSPRPWGCFLLGLAATLTIKVFPTPVGVFLSL